MATVVTATELQNVLGDYRIHLTGYDGTEEAAPERVENPLHWPANYHLVPDYRPINRHLNFEERPKGSNAVETAFLTVMFSGVFLNAVSWN